MDERKDWPKSGESFLDYFWRERRFADLILLAWQIVEQNIDLLVMNEFGLRYEDKKVRILVELTFQKKLEFLKENNVITNKEFQAVQTFQRYRNQLFHGKQDFYAMNKQRKVKIMQNAMDVVKLVLVMGRHRVGIPLSDNG